ncbi:MAG: hypothetical protein QOD58_2922 [Mycobacterium sp.]|jgi:hypothetical protein|nr:hypothetical protein [Mycobacterium sp.]
MAEPLAVDPARLIAAASKLTELIFPTPPSPISVAGADSVSAAINETMPGIESLVTDGMPGVTAALKRTATSMGAAADVYAKADQSLGQALSQYGFGADGQSLGAGALGALTTQSSQLLGAGAAGAMVGGPMAAAQQVLGGAVGQVGAIGAQVGAQAAAMSPQIAATIPQVVQLAPLAQQMAPMGQQVGQSVQQAASQGGQGGGGAPAQLASDTKPADDKKDDDEDKDEAEGADGATVGKTTLVSAPVEAASGGKPPAGSVAAPI